MRKMQIVLTMQQIGGIAYSKDPFTPTGLANQYAKGIKSGDWQEARNAAIRAYKYLQGSWWDSHKNIVKTRDGKPFQGSFVDFLAASDVSDESIKAVKKSLHNTAYGFAEHLKNKNPFDDFRRYRWR